jgi:hypothetical protein
MSKNMKNFSSLSIFRLFFRFQIFFRFILGSFSHQKTCFASLRNEVKQILFFAISLHFLSHPFCFFSLQAKIRGHPNPSFSKICRGGGVGVGLGRARARAAQKWIGSVAHV